MNRSKETDSYKHSGHHDGPSDVRREGNDVDSKGVRADRDIETRATGDSYKMDGHKTDISSKAKTVDTKDKAETSKPKMHSEVYCESSSYTKSGGHYHKEQHAEHKIDGNVVFKKDMVDDDGKVTSKEIDMDRKGHSHSKELGFDHRL